MRSEGCSLGLREVGGALPVKAVMSKHSFLLERRRGVGSGRDCWGVCALSEQATRGRWQV